ncbi:hypothetical protein PR048_013397 [Dryococelus australis]|uniref:Uncharacterized protein n=1 Tax=Dryococelus australis TaxID=614101 RepID=A0ABQ9HSH1_9NEOP|nr:hypothetical protein PR048_013397 [Dryococelus australis]
METVVAIIRQDIQSRVYDKTTYHPADNFLKDMSTLFTFLVKRKRKCISIAHSIITSVRPQSVMSPILISLGLLLYKKYCSKNLANILSSLGFCSSYYEVQLLEMSTILLNQSGMNGSFSQFVFDNAEFNVCTIDKWNTFETMVGIRCTTPESSVVRRTEIPRLTKKPSSKSSREL